MPRSASQSKGGIAKAFIAAFPFAISVPIAKLFLVGVGPPWLAACLYLGSGIGLALRIMLSRK